LSAAAEGGIGDASELGALELHEAVALTGDDELSVVNQAHAVLSREALGSGADEVDMRAFFENETGSLDGIAKTLDAGDATGAKSSTVHHECVELDSAVTSEEGAATSIEGVVVFHDGDGGLDSVERGALFRENRPTGGERVRDTTLVGGDGGGGHGPGTAVDEKNGLDWAARRGAHGI
jgi:hypothetical protein